ncbi:unnamed protein product [Dibothriocephalus latus]|uniref:Uncharacterized protein n=1 Tax=Dibothriocephalus latus TaxID=60516 RepID=A0A3P7KWU0_DIBLA|nr:unnamed protein product [Dibothriocephalus latus]
MRGNGQASGRCGGLALFGQLTFGQFFSPSHQLIRQPGLRASLHPWPAQRCRLCVGAFTQLGLREAHCEDTGGRRLEEEAAGCVCIFGQSVGVDDFVLRAVQVFE